MHTDGHPPVTQSCRLLTHKCKSFFTFIFVVLLQSADSIKFLTGSNTVFSDCDCL